MLFPEELINLILRFVSISCEIIEDRNLIGATYRCAYPKHLLRRRKSKDFGILTVNGGRIPSHIIHIYARNMVAIEKIHFMNKITMSVENLPSTLQYKHVYEVTINELFSNNELGYLNRIISRPLDKLKIIHLRGTNISFNDILNKRICPKSLYIHNLIFRPLISKSLHIPNFILEKLEINIRTLFDLSTESWYIAKSLCGLIKYTKRLKKLNIIAEIIITVKGWEPLFNTCPTLQMIKFKNNERMEVYRLYRNR